MNESHDYQTNETEIKDELEMPDQDDRYPGSFFRIPGIPVPSETTWSIN